MTLNELTTEQLKEFFYNQLTQLGQIQLSLHQLSNGASMIQQELHRREEQSKVEQPKVVLPPLKPITLPKLRKE